MKPILKVFLLILSYFFIIGLSAQIVSLFSSTKTLLEESPASYDYSDGYSPPLINHQMWEGKG